MTFRILVTGSRAWEDSLTIGDALEEAAAGRGDVIVVHGGAGGADAIAQQWALANGWRQEQHGVFWGAPCKEDVCTPSHRRKRWDGAEYCPSAGPLRNQRMVDAGADMCLAFNRGNSRGTADCVQRARAAGIPVREWRIA